MAIKKKNEINKKSEIKNIQPDEKSLDNPKDKPKNKSKDNLQNTPRDTLDTNDKNKTTKETPISKEDEKTNAIIKELENAFFTFKFYPVAVTWESHTEAREKIKKIYHESNETVRQLVLYMIHENLSQTAELKTMYNFDFYRRKFPNTDSSQVRVNVYRSMFHYHFSLEGMISLVKLLAELDGTDAAKVLTYHFSFLSTIEVEGAHILRNAIIEALSECTCGYALETLLSFARYTDNERLLQRIANALVKWDAKIETLKTSKKDKERLRESLQHVLTLEFGDSHYG